MKSNLAIWVLEFLLLGCVSCGVSQKKMHQSVFCSTIAQQHDINHTALFCNDSDIYCSNRIALVGFKNRLDSIKVVSYKKNREFDCPVDSCYALRSFSSY